MPAKLLTGPDIQTIFETVLPRSVIEPLVREAEFQRRERLLDAVTFVRAMVIAAGSRDGGRQAGIMQQYFEMGGPEVVRGAFYRWFGPSLETTMEAVSQLALEYARRQPVDLPGLLGEHVKDWHIVDSTTVKLDDALKAEYPGAGDYAAIKVHQRLSVGVGTSVGYHFSPAREHDAIHLTIDESWRGLGLLADLGYASLRLLEDCEAHDTKYVIRLKENWKPRVTTIARGTVKGTFLAGTDLDLLLSTETLVLDGRVIDADVEVGCGRRAIACRLVGVPTAVDGEYRFYLTNLPPAVGPHQIADLYRVRWEIELENKLEKSGAQLDEIGARKGCVVRALLHASVVASVLANLITHVHRLATRPAGATPVQRTVAPLHPRLVLRYFSVAALRIAELVDRRGPSAEREWQQIAQLIEHVSQDPNWRRRPSILDQLRGWKVAPGRKRGARLSSKALVAN